MKALKVITGAILLLVVSSLAFYSCKKTDVRESNRPEDLRSLYNKKLQNEPLSSTQIFKGRFKGYFGDINGKEIVRQPGRSGKIENSTCLDFFDSEAAVTQVSVTTEYTCGVGYRFLVSYTVESEFYLILGSNPNISGGQVRLRNSGGTLHTTAFAALLSLTNNGVIGQNGNGIDLNEFVVTYRTPVVSESIYDLATQIQPNLKAYTDCIDYPTFNVPYANQITSPGSQHNTLPCLRIDKVFWNPSTGVGASVAGCDAVPGCFPFGYVFPDRQEIEVFVNGDWRGIRLWNVDPMSPPPPAPPTYLYQTRHISPYDVWFIDMNGWPGSPSTISNGNYQVRYRNDMNSGTPCVTEPAGTWITETWYISI